MISGMIGSMSYLWNTEKKMVEAQDLSYWKKKESGRRKMSAEKADMPTGCLVGVFAVTESP